MRIIKFYNVSRLFVYTIVELNVIIKRNHGKNLLIGDHYYYYYEPSSPFSFFIPSNSGNSSRRLKIYYNLYYLYCILNFRVRGKNNMLWLFIPKLNFQWKRKKITVSQSLRFIPSTLRHEIRATVTFHLCNLDLETRSTRGDEKRVRRLDEQEWITICPWILSIF